jgi:hypothetical protein
MPTENSTNQDEANYAKVKLAQLHMELAHVINRAKRRMVERSREGTPLGKAAEAFQEEVTAGLSELIPANDLQSGDSVPVMSDERINELTGRLQRSVDNSLREMADAIRGGKCPGEAFQDVMSAFIRSGTDIPRHEYDGMTHTEWWADKERRAEAIMADDSGRYADSTKAAIKLVYDEMKTPGNQKKTKLEWQDYGAWIKRAEAGEVLDVSSECPDSVEREKAAAEHEEWRDKRYGSGFTPLTSDELHRLASTVTNGDTDAAELMLLLADEIERVLYGEYGAINVSSMCTTIREAVMPYTVEFSDLAQSIADRKRAEWTGAPDAPDAT